MLLETYRGTKYVNKFLFNKNKTGVYKNTSFKTP